MESSSKLPPPHSGRPNMADSSGEHRSYRSGSLDRMWKRPLTPSAVDSSSKEPGHYSYIQHCRSRKFHSFPTGLEDSSRTPHPETLEARLGGFHRSSHTSTHQDNGMRRWSCVGFCKKWKIPSQGRLPKAHAACPARKHLALVESTMEAQSSTQNANAYVDHPLQQNPHGLKLDEVIFSWAVLVSPL